MITHRQLHMLELWEDRNSYVFVFFESGYKNFNFSFLFVRYNISLLSKQTAIIVNPMENKPNYVQQNVLDRIPWHSK